MNNRHENHIKDTSREEQEVQRILRDWIEIYGHLFTHAVTLTFNHTKVRRRMMKLDPSLTLASDDMLNIYTEQMRRFKWRLAKSLYGNAWKRHRKPLVWIPVIEGLGKGQKPHYHCILGVASDRHPVVEENIIKLWSETPFGGSDVTVKPYRDSGWSDYSTKCAKSVNRTSVDWLNVLVPQE